MKTTTVTVTPEQASKWIARDEKIRSEKNDSRQRHLTVGKINQYASDMMSGRFKLTHQGILLDEEGRILDGRHRLRAVMVAKKPVEMLVSNGVSNEEAPDILRAIDCGRPRDAATQLWIADGIENSTPICAGVRSEVEIVMRDASRGWLSPAAIEEIYNAHSTAMNEIVRITIGTPKMKRGYIIGPLSMYASVHRFEAIDFATSLVSGTNLGPTHPVLWLSRSLEKYRERAKRSVLLGRMVTNAIQAFHDNKRINAILTFNDTGAEWLQAECPKLTKVILNLKEKASLLNRALLDKPVEEP